jgi:tetratricopeptide (TPR) repeat protein
MKIKKYLAVFFIISSAVFLEAQQVIRINNLPVNLAEQFNLAFNKGETLKDFWIGYSIELNSDTEIMVGSFPIDDKYEAVTLRDIISGDQKAIDYFSKHPQTGRKSLSERSFRMINGTSINEKRNLDKETAILFKYDKDSKSINDFRDIGIANLSRNFDLRGYPLIWLGRQDNKNSVDFLFNFYDKQNDTENKKELVAAIGTHTDQYPVTTFLINVILSKANPELRKDVGFWLGLQNNKDALAALEKVINNDAVPEVRKNAVWGIGYIKLPEALDALVYIAKHNSEREVRRNAIYALGNKAVKKAEEALKDIVDNDPNVEIKKTAVYALANNSEDAIPYLIKIAKTNSSLEVRKSAIYSLGNSSDERALDALIELAKKQ